MAGADVFVEEAPARLLHPNISAKAVAVAIPLLTREISCVIIQ